MIDLAPQTLGLLSVLLLLVLVYGGMHVGVALTATSFLGVWLLRDNMEIASRLLGIAASDAISDYVFGVIPLFVLMGLLVSVARIGEDCFDVANALLGRIRGGLGVATVGANAIFAAITGISIAAAAVFSRIAVPQMLRFGYAPRFAAGVVAGSSVLGMLIPPSLLFILYGVLTEQSIGSLFVAGILPGILLALAYCTAIVAAAAWRPGLIFRDGKVRAATLPGAMLGAADMAGRMMPIMVLVLLVLGGIYGGIFTPTEAGAVGALGALVIAFVRGRLDRRGFWKVLVETGQITASVCLLLIGASLYSRFLALAGVPDMVSQAIIGVDLGVPLFLAAFIGIVILLGCIIDSSSIMLITLPIAFPVSQALGIDPIWFGVITVLAVEIGLLTPPFGLSVFVVKSALGPNSELTLNDIFIGTAPFALIMLIVLIFICLNPWMATALL